MADILGTKFTEYSGATHEKGGVTLGDTNNEVEGGETRYNDFVFSDRILVPETRKTFAEISKAIKKKYSNRPNDTIALRSLEKELKVLAKTQEALKQDIAPKPSQDEIRAQQAQQAQMQSNQPQQPQQPQQQEQQPFVQKQQMQQPQVRQPIQQAFGGVINKLGGGTTNPDGIDGTEVSNKNANGNYIVILNDAGKYEFTDDSGIVRQLTPNQVTAYTSNGVDLTETGLPPIADTRYNTQWQQSFGADGQTGQVNTAIGGQGVERVDANTGEITTAETYGNIQQPTTSTRGITDTNLSTPSTPNIQRQPRVLLDTPQADPVSPGGKEQETGKFGTTLGGYITKGQVANLGGLYDIYRGLRGGSPEYYDRIKAAKLEQLDPTRNIQQQQEVGNATYNRIRQVGGQGLGQFLNNTTQAGTATEANIANVQSQYDNANVGIRNQEAMNRQQVQGQNIGLDIQQNDINARERDEASNTLQRGLTATGEQLGVSMKDAATRKQEDWVLNNLIKTGDYAYVRDANGNLVLTKTSGNTATTTTP